VSLFIDVLSGFFQLHQLRSPVPVRSLTTEAAKTVEAQAHYTTSSDVVR